MILCNITTNEIPLLLCQELLLFPELLPVAVDALCRLAAQSLLAPVAVLGGVLHGQLHLDRLLGTVGCRSKAVPGAASDSTRFQKWHSAGGTGARWGV